MEDTELEGMFNLGMKLAKDVNTNACGQQQTKIWDPRRWQQVAARLQSGQASGQWQNQVWDLGGFNNQRISPSHENFQLGSLM